MASERGSATNRLARGPLSGRFWAETDWSQARLLIQGPARSTAMMAKVVGSDPSPGF